MIHTHPIIPPLSELLLYWDIYIYNMKVRWIFRELRINIIKLY